MTSVEPTGWLPDYVTITQLLTPVECRALIAQSESRYYSAVRIAEDGTTYVDTSFRDCETAHFRKGDAPFTLIRDRLSSRLAEINAAYDFELYTDPDAMVEVMNVNAYHANRGHIGWHTDVGGYVKTENCKLSVIIKLNDAFEGGQLRLNTGYLHEPLNDAAIGDAIVVPTFVLHSVGLVTAGVRHSAIVWLRGPRFR